MIRGVDVERYNKLKCLLVKRILMESIVQELGM